MEKPRTRSRSAEAREAAAALARAHQQQQRSTRSKSPGVTQRSLAHSQPPPAVQQPATVPTATTAAAAVPAASREELLRGIDKKLQEAILNEVVERSPGVAWDDIGGLQDVKRALYEAIILPSLRPDLFRGLRAPPRGLLLFGPPGNGKTMIAKAVANESKATFFNVSASTLTSKWVGEGEKLVKALFALARYLQPTVIFIDEVDSILTERTANDHDAMRRLKTEFLVQFDGMNTSPDERLFVMGATNRPQDLDEAARRRFPKRIYVKLPDASTRREIITKLLRSHPHSVTSRQLAGISEQTEGYSAADLTALCKEAAMAPLRELGQSVATVDAASVRPIAGADLVQALRIIRPSVSQESLAAFAKWNQDFGCLN